MRTKTLNKDLLWGEHHSSSGEWRGRPREELPRAVLPEAAGRGEPSRDRWIRLLDRFDY